MNFSSHHFDDDGKPAGGQTWGPGFTIAWQNGPLGPQEAREQPNGAFVETVILACIDRLSYYQRSDFASDYNRKAIECLVGALDNLQKRTADREARGVEGLHEV
jgi:hypothetical protein